MENRCVICGEIIPEGTMVCYNCLKSNENLVTPEFICEQLAERFDEPCNMSPFEEELHDTEEKDEWCNKFCGKATATDCWMRYFQLKYNEKEGNTNE